MLPARPRIFLGTSDTASCLSALAEGFRANGCATTTMVTCREIYTPDATYDIIRGREIRRVFDYSRLNRIAHGVVRRLDKGLSIALNGRSTHEYLDHDVFVFILEPWAPEPLLYPLLKKLGKKIVVYYLGSDVRHVSAYEQEFYVDTARWQHDLLLDPVDRKIQHIRWGELYADVVYSVPDQAGLQIRPYHHAHVPLRAPLTPRVPGRDVPVILHAPSRQDLKGTSFVVRAIEALRAEGLRFEFRLITGMPRAEVLAALESSDIVVDELLLHGPGVLSAEAMMAGCAVATRIIDPPMPCFAPPVVNTRPENVQDVVRRLIIDREYRISIARRASEWALRAFDPTVIAKHVLSHLEGEELPDYVPRFYLERYRPPRPDAISQLSRRLSLRVTQRFRPEEIPRLHEAARRGVVALPPRRSRAVLGAVR